MTVRYAEPEIKIERLKQFILEEMFFDHSEIVNRLITDRKFHTLKRNLYVIKL